MVRCHWLRIQRTQGEREKKMAIKPKSWIADAVASQEEHIKRWNSCGDVVGKSHDFQTFHGPDSSVPVPGEVTWRQCTACDVTESRDDYERKMGAQA